MIDKIERNSMKRQILFSNRTKKKFFKSLDVTDEVVLNSLKHLHKFERICILSNSSR